jgi:hypothetical protein
MATARVASQNLLGDASARPTLADAALCVRRTFSNAFGRIVTANIVQRSEPDANTVLVNKHTCRAAAGGDVVAFEPCFDGALAHINAQVYCFRALFPSTLARAAMRRSCSAATSRTYTAPATCVDGSYALAVAC